MVAGVHNQINARLRGSILPSPEKSSKYPPEGDILVMSHHDILTIVNPSTDTGRVYTPTQEEMDLASGSLASR